MIRALIVEDNNNSIEALLSVIRFFDGEIAVVGVANTLALAKPLIESTNPDILLLDIELPDGNSMDMVETLENRPWIIFISGHDKFMQKAFEFPTIHYLLKPISFKRFQEAIEKYKDYANRNNNYINKESGTLESKKIFDKIALSYAGKLNIIEINNIVRLEASGNYSQVILADGTNMLVAYTLMYFEGHLPPDYFIRINRSNIVNINHIRSYDKPREIIILNNNDFVSVGKNRHNDIEEAISKIALTLKS